MKSASLVTILAVVTLLLTGCGRAPEPVSLSFFYLPLCPTCPETAQMEAIAGELAGIDRAHEHVTARIHVLGREDGAAALRNAAEAAGIDVRATAFPVLFENGHVHAGFEEIEDYLASW